MEDVLEARTASTLKTAPTASKIFPLGRSFDNERRVRHRGIASDRFDPAEQGISVLLGHFFFGDQLAQRLCNAVFSGFSTRNIQIG
jgi:hypothetical protein